MNYVPPRACSTNLLLAGVVLHVIVPVDMQHSSNTTAPDGRTLLSANANLQKKRHMLPAVQRPRTCLCRARRTEDLNMSTNVAKHVSVYAPGGKTRLHS